MPRAQTPAPLALPNLESSLFAQNVDEVKWYVAALPGSTPTRKAELVSKLVRALTDPAELKRLWEQLTPVQQQVVAEVVYNQGGRYNADVIEAKYPGSQAPRMARSFGFSMYAASSKKTPATAFDLFFAYDYDLGRYIPTDLAQLLRALATPPPATRLHSHATPPPLPTLPQYGDELPELTISDAERAVFHDLGAALYLIQQGKGTISPATRMPTLGTLRNLRQNLLASDYFADGELERAEDAIRPLALIVLVQAAKWAAPTTAGNKLELTKAGQTIMGGPLNAQHIREAYTRWLKSDLLDELSRIRNIKGQQAKGTRLTKPAERRGKLDTTLRALPLGSWVEMDELLRYMRAEDLLPAIERAGNRSLGVGSYSYYDDGQGFSSAKYWDVITGSYLRAVLWEYVGTLGMIEIAYTWPEDSPHSFGDLYYLDAEYLSRYDGLLDIRLTNLGAYVLGLADEYEPPALVTTTGAPVLKVLPNLDIVVTDAARLLPNDRTFLERMATEMSQDVFRLSREQLLEAASSGLDIQQIKQFLAANSGQSVDEFPQIVRVFFEDLEKRLSALHETGNMLVLTGDDPYLLTELSNHPALRALVQLGTIGDQPVLLVPEQHETAVRRQLKKLGYLPRKG